MADCTSERKSGALGEQKQFTAQHGTTFGSLSPFKRVRHLTRAERVRSRGHARRIFEWCRRCDRCLPRDDSFRNLERSFQRGVPYKLVRIPGFGLKVWLSVTPRSAVC